MSRRTRFILVASLVVVLAVAAASLASGAMVLPGFLAAETATFASGKGVLSIEGGAAMRCEKDLGHATFNAGSTNLGPFTLDFEGCTQGGEPCMSLGDLSLTILVSGEWHLVLLEGTPMKWFILFLPKETHIECPKAAIKLLLVKGSILGLLEKKSGEKSKKFNIKLEQTNGVQSEKFYENNAGGKIESTLATSQEGGKAKKSALESEGDAFEFPNENDFAN